MPVPPPRQATSAGRQGGPTDPHGGTLFTASGAVPRGRTNGKVSLGGFNSNAAATVCGNSETCCGASLSLLLTALHVHRGTCLSGPAK